MIRVHFEGDLDIRQVRGGVWTTRITMIRTKGRGLPACFAPFGSSVTAQAELVTCKRCRTLMEKARVTALYAPLTGRSLPSESPAEVQRIEEKST